MIIAIANQKGGVGKSATAQAIATGALKAGKKTLAIDLDAQGNLTFSMGGNAADVGAYELLTGQATPGEIIQHTAQGDLIAASRGLAIADTTFNGKQRTEALKEAIRPVKKKYDLIVIDCPPSLNTLLLNALYAADGVIIPLTADIFALQGLYQLADTIKSVQQDNKGLEVLGVLFTMYSPRTVISRDLADTIREKCADLNIPVFKTTIRTGVAVREAETQRESIFDYAPRSNPAKDYKKLLEEINAINA